MNRNDYDELQSRMSEVPPLKESPWRPDIQATADEPKNLRKFIFKLSAMISKQMIDDQTVGMDWFYDKIYETLVLNFRGWLYGEVVDYHTVKYPRDWFQHLKQRILPVFIKEKWPVRYTTVAIEVRAMYPKLRKKLTLQGEEHVFHVVEEEYDEEE